MIDEKESNVRWLEAARDNFNEAIGQRNWAQAFAVVDDIAKRGFPRAAFFLGKDVLAAKMRV